VLAGAGVASGAVTLVALVSFASFASFALLFFVEGVEGFGAGSRPASPLSWDSPRPNPRRIL
jgi:hypothetical protein